MNLSGGDSDSRAVLCALIGLMEDPDPLVRIRFSQSMRFLLTESATNSEQGALNEVRNFSNETKSIIVDIKLAHTFWGDCGLFVFHV